MNCKPGSLARIVGPATSPNRDRLVRCIRLLACGEEMEFCGLVFTAASHDQFWAVEGRLDAQGAAGEIVSVPGGPIGDKWLRPIRDPGDDAADETLGWLPVPSKDIQHAMDDLRAHIAQGAREKAGAA